MNQKIRIRLRAFDHRAIDVALGAELAAAFKNYIENPMGMLV